MEHRQKFQELKLLNILEEGSTFQIRKQLMKQQNGMEKTNLRNHLEDDLMRLLMTSKLKRKKWEGI